MIPERLRELESWCVSKDKMPLDMYALANGYEWGASNKRSHSSYVNYDAAAQVRAKKGLPVTLLVDASVQAIYVIDIEKTCPQEIRQAIMLALHDSVIYLERSLSGKGYHLIVECEAAALATAKYKKWLEILSNHHCTFTENEVDFQTAFFEEFDTNEFVTDDDKDVELLNALSSPVTGMQFYDLIGSSAQAVRIADSATFDEYKKAVKNFDGRHADLFGLLCDMEYAKTVDKDFHGDYSAYEFGYASKLHYMLRRVANDMIDADCNHYELPMSKEESIMLVYMVLKQCMAPREKHKSMRNGLPWLLYTSQQVYVKTFEKEG